MPSSNNESNRSSSPGPQSNGNSGNSQSSSQSTNSSSSGSDQSGNTFVPIYDLSISSVVSVSDISLSVLSDISLSIPCDSSGVPVFVSIVSDLSSSTVNGIGYSITTSQGTGADGSYVVDVSFATTNPELYDPQIFEHLQETVSMYDDETDASGQTVLLLNEIRSYAAQIQCTEFQGKGSIEDYTTLFQAASRIATDVKQIDLNIDIEGFNEFAQAADDLSSLFNGFITKLQSVNIISDIGFLRSISIALSKIVNLSKTFGRFKETVLATTTIKIPKSSHDAAVIIQDVMDEVNCAMQYINYFVSPETDPSLNNAHLSAAEKNIIQQAVNTIDNWNILCEQGVTIAMVNDVDVQQITQASNELKQITTNLRGTTNTLRNKLSSYNILC